MKLTSYYQRICERSKEREDTSPYVLPISQNLLWNLSWLSDTQHQDPKWEWQARDNLEINPITIKPEAASHTAEQFCWIPLPCCSQSRHPFPIKSLALLVWVSPQTIYELYTRDNSQALKGVPLPAAILHGCHKNKRKSFHVWSLRSLLIPSQHVGIYPENLLLGRGNF